MSLFDERIAANSALKQTLAAMTQSGRLPHAILLEGEKGCGKKTIANLIAAAAVCTGGEKPCGICRHCKKALAHTHPDILLIDGAGGAGSLNVEKMRSVRADMHVVPNEAAAKVYIIAEAHNMTAAAQNALLKAVEEPPENVMVILTCENSAALLETLQSRLCRLRVYLPGPEEAAAVILQILPDADPAKVREAAEYAAGNIGRALTLLQDPDFEKTRADIKGVLESALAGRTYEILRKLAVYESDRQAFVQFMSGLRSAAEAALSAGAMNNPRLGGNPRSRRLIKIIDTIADAERKIRQNTGVPLTAALFAAQCGAD